MPKLEEIDKSLSSMDRVFGLIYLHLTRPAFEKLGLEGERAVRNGLRAYGQFRGDRLRNWHLKEGLPINMESLLRYWDISSVRTSGCYADDAVFSPYYVEHPATNCSFFDVCKETDFTHYGYTYCDEIHQEICMAYQPRASVEIHENLMKGDSRCHFKWMMIPQLPEDKIDRSGYDRLEKRWKEAPLQKALFYLKKDVQVLGMLYYFLAKGLIEKFGEKGRTSVRVSLRELGHRRGMELKARLKEQGREPSLESIFADLPYKYLWKMKLERPNGDLHVIVEHCPLAEIWNDLGDKELGSMYCEIMYSSMLGQLLPRAEVRIATCMAKGEGSCRLLFEFKRKS